ncbi:MAG: hypothetical protein EBR82_56980 [Caulobacteraceae bacterium]|nr:hypothetical protein [Caulobacteraceae bacterium]
MSKSRPAGRISINVTRIDKAHLVDGKNGKYLNVTFWENETPDQYGNAGFVTQEVSQQAREQGVKGAIIGNWKRVEPRQSAAKPSPKPDPKPTSPVLPTTEEDDVPF